MKRPMNKMIRILIFFLVSMNVHILSNAQNSKKDYLKENKHDLLKEEYTFPEQDFNIIGFGALHGSAKTYDAELLILKSLLKQNLLEYYFPETNFSQAFFFEQYLNSGNEDDLKKLTLAFQAIVSQEGTIETYNHWKNLKKINDELPSHRKIKILGCDIILEYEYPIKHILFLTQKASDWELRGTLKGLLLNKDLSFGLRDSVTVNTLKKFVTDFEENRSEYVNYISDTASFNHIIKNIKISFQDRVEREKAIYANYLQLQKRFGLANKKQFFKYGYFHIQKSREQNYPSFFTRLIENKIYKKNEIITIMGYLTNSKVLWDKLYDKQGEYKKYTIKRGFGISDYWKEYFKGIKYLKRAKLSDITLYKIAGNNSPYSNGADLVEIKMFLKDYNFSVLKGKKTTDFIDYAVLISDSKEQVPIEELEE